MATQTSTQTSKVVPTRKYNRPPPPSRIPLHGLDLLATPIHIRNHRFYHRSQTGETTNATDVVKKLKTSLAEALELYPLVTGTVHDNGQGELHIAMDAANIQAIPFIFDAKDTPYVEDSEELSPRTETLLAPGSPILAVKITLFSCGTLALASSLHHQVADLRGFLDFLQLWAQLTRGEPVDFSKIPNDWTHTPSRFFSGLHERSSVSIPPPGFRVLPAPALGPPAFLLVPSEVTRWKLTKTSVEKLKNDFSPVTTASKGSWISSGDAIAALLCAAVTRARENAKVARLGGRSSVESQVETFMMAADGRERSPGGKMLDGQYFGNFNPLFETVVQRSDLLSLSNEAGSRVALAIRNALSTQLLPEAIADKCAFMEDPRNSQPPRIAWTADVIGTNWCRFDLQGPKLDFGWGKPFLATQGGGTVFPPGYFVLTQDKTSGDVVALLTVENAAAAEVKVDALLNKYASAIPVQGRPHFETK